MEIKETVQTSPSTIGAVVLAGPPPPSGTGSSINYGSSINVNVYIP